jgi:hypothetical protein
MESDSGIYLCQNCLEGYVFEPQPAPKTNGTTFLCRDCRGKSPLFVKIKPTEHPAWINFWPV